jgi:ABC-type Zn2+ transport system substrate-binding protein/surface adhesin
VIAQRLPDHILDAEVVQLESGTWFIHDHEHQHEPPGHGQARHRHDHRRRSHRGDYDHHLLEPAGDGDP